MDSRNDSSAARFFSRGLAIPAWLLILIAVITALLRITSATLTFKVVPKGKRRTFRHELKQCACKGTFADPWRSSHKKQAVLASMVNPLFQLLANLLLETNELASQSPHRFCGFGYNIAIHPV